MTDTVSLPVCGYTSQFGPAECGLPAGHDGAHCLVIVGATPAPPVTARDTLLGVSNSLDTLTRHVPYGVFGRTGRFTMSEPFTIQTIAKPRQVRDGSINDAQVDAVFDAFATGKVPDGEAVIVTRGLEKENTARNRARTLADRVKERHGTKDSYKALAAHAIPDPAGTDAKPLFIGAVSLKPVPKPKTPAKPAAAAAK